MAILGVGNAANQYMSPESKGAKAANAANTANDTQPIGADNSAREPSGVVFGSGQTAAGESGKDKAGSLHNDKAKNVSRFEPTASKPSDTSAALMRRLVTALGQFQVRQVITEANKSLMSLRALAAAGKGEDAALARAYSKKLEKVLARANRKLDDLDKEDMLKFQQARAEKQKQERRAKEIEQELREKQNERKARENGYLSEAGQPVTGNAQYSPAINQNFVSDAAIAAQAAAIAAAETAAVSTGSVDGGGSVAAAAGASPVSDAGAAVAAAEGGGESAE